MKTRAAPPQARKLLPPSATSLQGSSSSSPSSTHETAHAKNLSHHSGVPRKPQEPRGRRLESHEPSAMVTVTRPPPPPDEMQSKHVAHFRRQEEGSRPQYQPLLQPLPRPAPLPPQPLSPPQKLNLRSVMTQRSLSVSRASSPLSPSKSHSPLPTSTHPFHSPSTLRRWPRTALQRWSRQVRVAKHTN